MTSKITQQLVGDFSRRTYGGTNDCYGITVHETANKTDGATAQAHANLQSRYGTRGSWHAQADDLGVIESYRDVDQCWHAGDGRGTGNLRTLAIEICVNLDESEEKQVEAYKSAAYWVATKMVKHSIPLSRVFQHNKFSTFNKDCPDLLRAGKYWTWEDFKVAIAAYVIAIKAGEAVDILPPSKPVPPPTTGPGLDVDGWWGKATIRALQSALGTPVDGEVWSQNDKWESRNPALTSGWIWVDPQEAKGSKVIQALQAWVNAPSSDCDGLIGPQTIRLTQDKLRAMGLYAGKSDGELWKQSSTVKALQKALNEGRVKA